MTARIAKNVRNLGFRIPNDMNVWGYSEQEASRFFEELKRFGELGQLPEVDVLKLAEALRVPYPRGQLLRLIQTEWDPPFPTDTGSVRRFDKILYVEVIEARGESLKVRLIADFGEADEELHPSIVINDDWQYDNEVDLDDY